jgi:hypothetical protein
MKDTRENRKKSPFDSKNKKDRTEKFAYIVKHMDRYCFACHQLSLVDEGEGVIFCSDPICPSNDPSGNIDPY